MDKFIIITGGPVDGSTYHGPFDTADEAIEWADHSAAITDCWWVAELNPPAEEENDHEDH
jgi:hypothetical protein